MEVAVEMDTLVAEVDIPAESAVAQVDILVE